MANMARSMAAAEKAIGLNSEVYDAMSDADWEKAKDSDIHVIHTHCPDAVLSSGKPLIWVAHGTPEVMFEGGYNEGLIKGSYGHGDPWMLAQYWLQHCDVTLTFWERHRAIWKSMADKRTRVEMAPMGVNLDFWKPTPTAGKFAGSPSLFTAENCYRTKWPLDLFIAWPWVTKKHNAARLHAIYLPKDQHRWWFPLINRNGASFRGYMSAMTFDDEHLRNAFCSTDFYIGLVRYGDHNLINLEANSSGAKTISYRGNEYADYWITEGDQRTIADELIAIMSGSVTPRQKLPVPSITETANAMKAIYESL